MLTMHKAAQLAGLRSPMLYTSRGRIALTHFSPAPKPEPDEIGTCCACGDTVLSDEQYDRLESGKLLHYDRDCWNEYMRKLTGRK